MRLFDTDISNSTFQFLKSNNNALKSTNEANELMQNECGIIDFFANNTELLQLNKELNEIIANGACESKAEYGDFQTNQSLAIQITKKLKSDGLSPEIVIEPTCGKGNFILAVLNTFNRVKRIYGIEIQKNILGRLNSTYLTSSSIIPTKKNPQYKSYIQAFLILITTP